MENKDLQGLVKIKDYHVEAAKKMIGYSQTEGMRPNDKKHYEKRAKEHLDMVDVLQALILAPPAPTIVDLANSDADGYRNGRESVVVELPELRGDSDADDIAGVGLVIPMFDRGYDEAIEECRAAIIAAGGSVKA